MTSEWNCTSFGKVCSHSAFGPRFSGDEYAVDGNVACLRTMDIDSHGRIDYDAMPLAKLDLARLKSHILQPRDLVITRTGAYLGKVGLFEQFRLPVLAGAFSIRFRINESAADPIFLKYFFNGKQGQEGMHSIATGSAQPNLNIPRLHSLTIPCPPLPAQRAIASVLSSLDDKIDLLHRQNKTLEAMAETLFRQWFVEEAKEDWEVTTFAMHIDAYRGLSYKGNGLAEVGMGVPMHNLNSVFEGGGYKEAGIKYYSGDFKERHIVRAGDVIVTNTEQGHEFRLIGFPAIVPHSFGDTGIFSQHIYRVVPKEKTYLTSEFLYYLMMVPEVREQITSATNGSTVNMLAIDGLQRPTFRLPPNSKVTAFQKIAKDCRRKAELNHGSIRTLEKLRDNLLPKLMSGEVRVQYE